MKDPETLGERYITVEPDIRIFDIDENCEFIILACDGLWDVVSNEEAVEYVRGKLHEYREEKPKTNKDRNMDIFLSCMYLAQLAREKGSKDNISCLIATFNHDGDNPGPDVNNEPDIDQNSDNKDNNEDQSD